MAVCRPRTLRAEDLPGTPGRIACRWYVAIPYTLGVSVGHYENFPVASRLVSAEIRPAVVALYRFARSADDIADEGEASPGERLQALAAYDQALRGIAVGETPPQALFRDLAHAVRRHALPLAPLHDMLSAFRQDVWTRRYARFVDLLDYCQRSANPVGRLVLALHGVAGSEAMTASDALCTGLQLVNICQDVARDWRLGRVYLPQEELAHRGIDDAQIAAGRCDEAWRCLMAFQTDRARRYLDEGRVLPGLLPWRAGLELAGVIEGGARILERIDAIGGDVFARRPVLRTADWLLVGCRALLHPRPPSVRLR